MDVLTDLNTAFELEERQPQIAFLPVGATEQHSRHLPLATDTLLGDRLSADVIARVARPGAVYLLRTLPFSSSCATPTNRSPAPASVNWWSVPGTAAISSSNLSCAN